MKHHNKMMMMKTSLYLKTMRPMLKANRERPNLVTKKVFTAGQMVLQQVQLAEARRELGAHKSHADISTEEHEKLQKKLKGLLEDLQDWLEKRQDELIDTEEELLIVTAEFSDAKSNLVELEEQKAQLADELDVANSHVEQVCKTEATVMATV
jgi:chromosome segregation ATPase